MARWQKSFVATLVASVSITAVYFIISGLILGNAWVGKSYSRSSLGLKFRYPASYELTEQLDDLDHLAIQLTLPVISISLSSKKFLPPIAVDVYDNPGNESLLNWLERDQRSGFRLSDGTTEIASLAGHPVRVYRWGDPYESETMAVAVENKIYLFTVNSVGSDNSVKNDYNFVLDSVKFGKVS